MLGRNPYKETVTNTDMDFHVHPGRGTTDWDLLSVLISRDNAEVIALKVILTDDAGDEYILGEYTTWTGTELVLTDLIRLDRAVEISIVTTGVTTGDVRARIITKLVTQE